MRATPAELEHEHGAAGEDVLDGWRGDVNEELRVMLAVWIPASSRAVLKGS